MTALTDVAPKLVPLVLLLSSDQPGEVVAAARRIGKTLADAGVDWHDLADAIAKPAPAPTVIYRDRAVQEPPPADWRIKARWLSQNAMQRMNAKERDFIQQMATETPDFRPSPKQSKWIDDLYVKLWWGIR